MYLDSMPKSPYIGSFSPARSHPLAPLSEAQRQNNIKRFLGGHVKDSCSVSSLSFPFCHSEPPFPEEPPLVRGRKYRPPNTTAGGGGYCQGTASPSPLPTAAQGSPILFGSPHGQALDTFPVWRPQDQVGQRGNTAGSATSCTLLEAPRPPE